MFWRSSLAVREANSFAHVDVSSWAFCCKLKKGFPHLLNSKFCFFVFWMRKIKAPSLVVCFG